jgi:hypothetical protein
MKLRHLLESDYEDDHLHMQLIVKQANVYLEKMIKHEEINYELDDQEGLAVTLVQGVEHEVPFIKRDDHSAGTEFEVGWYQDGEIDLETVDTVEEAGQLFMRKLKLAVSEYNEQSKP